ncbi:MAG: DUF262 domain-containing HNH endonuclease family protein [Bacteroidales bacterium]|nr:DUF262 domain-containing HNH endonuclease family protein [Bacteroidales bacterium]
MELLKMMSIKHLFEEEKQYIVPIYQRDYAWTHKEAKQLIDDIRDYIVDNKERSYYIGSLVVYSKGDNLYEVVDGQQRLTTLTIMFRALESKGVKIDSKLTNTKLSFEHRAQSTNSLKNLGEGDTSIDEMYHILQKANYGDSDEFTIYLLEKVKILLVEIPKDTDLNHYFEIMNTRGEQLEKHEVLKARLMNMLKYEDEEMRTTAHSLFNILWEACADMDSYAMMNIKADVRNVLYGDKGSNVPPLDSDFDSMLNQIIENGKQSGANNKITIEKIEKEAVNIAKVIEEFWGKNKNLEGYEIARDAQNNEKPERFKSIIDFQNFLLQTLSIYVAKKHVEDWRDIKIILDDKQLLQSFEKVEKKLVDEVARADFAKEFIVFLLRVRSLFDIYVLKSDSKDDNDGKWKIQKYDRSNNYVNTFKSKSSENEDVETNSDLEMIQSMFHFSYTSNTYKNWLNDTLNYIVDNEARLTSNDFYDWLWKLAKSYMLENYLKSDEGYDFSRLDRGCEVENFVFNFYDFVVWKSDNKNKYKDFKFTYRTSVEHFYPQHLKDDKYLYEDNSDSAKDPEHKVHQKTVNSFGNLCLITSSMNSRFSNLMPKAKYEEYGAGNEYVGKQSIKLMQMFEMAKKESTWNKKTIEDFTKDCKKTLADELGIEDNCHSEKTCSNPS